MNKEEISLLIKIQTLLKEKKKMKGIIMEKIIKKFLSKMIILSISSYFKLIGGFLHPKVNQISWHPAIITIIASKPILIINLPRFFIIDTPGLTYANL